MAGWIKLHRKILDNPVVMKSPEHFMVWAYLLLEATHEDYPTLWGKDKVVLKPGQVIKGRLQIARDLRINESKVKRILNDLKSDQQIDQQAKHYGSLITILNWHTYQNCDQQIDQQVTNERPTSDQRVTSKQEQKNKRTKEDINIGVYGEFQNVRLTDDEYKKLVDRFPMDYQDRVENLSQYLAKTGKRYKSHYATILSWDRKNTRGKQKPEEKPGRLDWLDELIEQEAANGV